MYSVKKTAIFISFLAVVLLPLAADEGMASWYGGKFQGRKTASGEIFDTYKYTAAHRALPFGTIVRVTNLDNQKEAVVRINDRGPFAENRIIDLSKAAAMDLDMMKTGVARVRVEIVSHGPNRDFYRIQVASYKEKGNADKVKTLLVEKGFTVYFENISSGHIRVSVDNIRFSALNDTKNKLQTLGFTNYLVKKIN